MNTMGMMNLIMGSSVSEEFTVSIFKRRCEDGGSLFLLKYIHSRLCFDSVEGNNLNAFWMEKRS